MAKTFMQEVYESVKKAAYAEENRAQLAGMSKESLVEVVGAVTEALDKLPDATSLHAVMFGVTYVRNSLQLAMDSVEKKLQTETGGTA